MVARTWLGVGVVHGVSIQLEELHRFRLLLSVAAHGEGVLGHLTGSESRLSTHPDGSMDHPDDGASPGPGRSIASSSVSRLADQRQTST